MGVMDKIAAGLLVAIVILGLLLALQGQRVKALSGDLAETKVELIQAYGQIDALNRSHSETMLALQAAIEESKQVNSAKEKTKKKIKGVVKDGKTDSDAVTAGLSDSMWDAYCARDSVGCASRQSP